MNRADRRATRKTLASQRTSIHRQSAEYGAVFVEVPRARWPRDLKAVPEKMYRNRRFLVQIFAPARGARRLTVCRTEITRDGNYRDGITWDELQEIKSQMGFGECDAVEVYPPDRDVANVANMRHLWVLDHKLSFVWRSSG